MKKISLAVVLLCAALPASAKDAPLYKSEDCGKYEVQIDMNTCAGNNYESADNALNAIYRQIMASALDHALKAKLRNSERSWIEIRDKTCDEEAAPDQGGSIYNMDLANCLEAKTAARIRVLKKMLAAP